MAENGVDFLLVDYYEDGHIKRETPFRGGRWHGTVKDYDRRGGIDVTTYYQGIIKGPCEVWHGGNLIMSQDVKLTAEPTKA